VRRALLGYIRRAKAASNKIETAKELQRMIRFNSFVVTALITEIKGEPVTVTPEHESEPETKPEPTDETEDKDDEMKLLTDLEEKSTKKAAKSESILPCQKEITLKDDIPYLDRANLYEAYLHYCLTGDVTKSAFGLQLPVKVADDEYKRLDQLGDILGLNPDETRQIRVNIAEKAFIKDAEVILADGQLTKSKMEQLTRLQNDVKLPEEHAQKVIKNIIRNKMTASLEAAVNRGRMGMKEVCELKEAKVDIKDVMSEALREMIFKKAVEEIFSSGKGEFDETEMYDKFTEDLGIDKEKATKVVMEIAKDRLGNSLVQAVAQLRQKNQDGVVSWCFIETSVQKYLLMSIEKLKIVNDCRQSEKLNWDEKKRKEQRFLQLKLYTEQEF
jgi:uncharacterized protein YdcH (DUF465 family)